VTPDGRYFVVKQRLWRQTRPGLSNSEKKELVSKLMKGRRDVQTATKNQDLEAVRDARRRVDEAKVALGERGPVWWDDGSPDYNSFKVYNTPYRSWWENLEQRTG